MREEKYEIPDVEVFCDVDLDLQNLEIVKVLSATVYDKETGKVILHEDYGGSDATSANTD